MNRRRKIYEGKAKGASVSDDMIRKKMAELTVTAREQVAAEG